MSRRQLDPTGDRDTLLAAGGLLTLLVVTASGAWASLHLAAWLTGRPAPPASPVELVIRLVTGRLAWTGTATGVAVGLAVVIGALVFLALWKFPRRPRLRSDASSRHMARVVDLAPHTAAGSSSKGARLGLGTPGLRLGEAIRGGQALHASWEDVLVVIAGPRTQKTTAYAVPWVLQAPGPCLATSNKRDVVDATASLRAERGRVWVFDPQRVAGTTSSWWWNPLTYIAPHDPATGRARRLNSGWVDADETRAEKLAGQFVMSARPAGARTDAYFDVEAENLIGLLLLAAACGDKRITAVYSWLTRSADEEPTDLLRENGFELQEQALYALSHLPDKQREGVYGTARSLLGFLRNRQVLAWVTPQVDRPQFHPAAYATSTDTLYPLSREGEASVGPLVAGLVLAVLDALEERATESAGGRLSVPFVGVLDEAANICKLRNLDSLYSHYGSRGLILATVLQSWHQGADVWGDHGIEKLWSAATIKIYGGGVDDDRFCRRLSELIGTTDRVVRSASVGRGSRTITRTVQDHVIMTPAELRELPKGRAVAFCSGTPAVLIEPRPWFLGPDCDKIAAAVQSVAAASDMSAESVPDLPPPLPTAS